MSGDGGEDEQVAKAEPPTTANTTTTATLTTAATTTVTTATATTTCDATPSTTPSATTPAPHTTPAPYNSPGRGEEGGIEREEEEEVGEDSGTEEASPERVVLLADQLATMSKEELIDKWTQQDKFVDSLLVKLHAYEKEAEEVRCVRESEERLKGQLAEVQRKEQYHVMRLSSKEHELQDLGVQIQELKSMSVGVGGLKHCLLDPAVNLLFERLKRDLDSARTKMEETQNELSAWKFTPDSNTGKQLMAKCRLLIKENEELGRMITSGRLAKLEGELALQKNFSEELKKSQSELDEFLLEIDEDTEGMQGTIYYLQQQLRQAKERINTLTAQLAATQTAGGGNTDDSCAAGNEGTSEHNSEAERTEANVAPQPNGDTSHYDMQSNSESSDKDNGAPYATPHLTNGRKRTQSDLDEGMDEGEGREGVEEGEAEADSVARKRTRTEGEGEGVGGGEGSALLENGVE